MKAIVYCRVSTGDQAESGLGMSAQHAAACGEAGRRGWDVETIEDRGASGKNLNRPGLQRALEQLRRGEAEVLVVAKLDRLSRSVVDFAALIERAQREGWAIVALDLGVDTSTPSGELVANVMASVAQWERRVIGQRTRDALAVKRSEGVRLGRPSLVPDEVRERILEAREDGQTYAAIAESLNAEEIPTAHGGARWYPATVRSVEKRAA